MDQTIAKTQFQNISVASNSKTHIGHAFTFGTDDPLRELHFADEAPHNSYSRQNEPVCLQGTRMEVLQEIDKWVENIDGPSIFWLSGRAGEGKSTIASTVSQHYSTAGPRRLAASFFFSQDGVDVSHARHFVSTIALQLVTEMPQLRQSISKEVSKDRNIINLAISEQWDRLVVRPISGADSSAVQWPLLIVVDALDECKHSSEVKHILTVFSDLQSGPLYRRIKVFLTSRPDLPIRPGFRNMPVAVHWDLVLHEVSRAHVDRDIKKFLKYKFQQIVSDSDYVLEGWPREEQVDELVRMVNGLFIFASTMCKFIASEQWPPQELLEVVLAQNIGRTDDQNRAGRPTYDLDRMYFQVLERPFNKLSPRENKADLLRLLRQILGSIAIAIEPLAIATIAAFIGISKESITSRLQHLHAVLDVPRDHTCVVRISHASFQEFLLDKTRCSSEDFWVNESAMHDILLSGCMRVMLAALKRNICKQDRSNVATDHIKPGHIELCMSPELRYACLYWVHHMQHSDCQLFGPGKIHKFLLEHFLHWLEALSWLGRILSGIRVLRELKSSIDASLQSGIISVQNVSLLTGVQADQHAELHSFVHDAIRFVMYAEEGITKYPLQVYISAIHFAPKQSVVRKHFEAKVQPPWMLRSPYVGERWTTILQTGNGHSDAVYYIAFSPDGKILASASKDRTVRLWDVTTKESIQVLTGHSGAVYHVVFSPDGKTLASASEDRTIRLWDMGSRESMRTLIGHSNTVYQVVFSPDGKTLASASRDRTVRLWNITARESMQTLTGFFDAVYYIVFSPDGKTLTTRAFGGQIRHWDITMDALRELPSNMIEPNTSESSVVNVTRKWITYKGVDGIWLPPDFRSDVQATSGHNVALGYGSGHVLFWEFGSVS